MAKEDKDFIRRGDLMQIIQNLNRSENVPATYDNTLFMEKLVDKVFEQPSRWPNGDRMRQSVRLDADLVLKEDVIESLELERNSNFKNRIVSQLIEEMDKYDGRPR